MTPGNEWRNRRPRVQRAHTGFDVVDRNGEHVGTVRQVNLARTCIVETSGSFLRRKQHHDVHVSAVDDINLDASTISLTVTGADGAGAPEFRELDEECEAAVARYYRALS